MLYLRWKSIAVRHAERPAVFLGGGEPPLSFADLAALAERAPAATAPVIARSGGVEFLIETLRAWRDEVAVVPVEKDAPAPELPAAIPPRTALIKYTAGSSGVPRCIFFSAEQVAADADQLVAGMKLAPDRPNLAVISPAHSYGFSSLVLPLLLHGIPLHIVPVPFPNFVAEALRAHPRATLPAVPTLWRAWLRAGILDHPDLLAISAGAPLSLELERAIHSQTGIKLHNFYGTSECGGISYDATDAPRTDARDVGAPLPGVSLAVENGRLAVASAAVATGYEFSRPGDDLGHGRFLTRDLATLEGGRVLLHGTGGDAINVAGRKVSPAGIEADLSRAGAGDRVKVFGVPSADRERVEEIVAALDAIDAEDLSRLKLRLAESLQSWEFPRHWWIGPPLELWGKSAAAWAEAWKRR